MTGPRAAEGGYDYMMQGLAGWQSLTGEPDGPPTKSGLSLVDLSGGYASAIALLAGVWRARRDGVGCDCDVSLFETALHELMYIGPWAATHGYVPPRRANSAHPTIVPVPELRSRRRLVRPRCGEAGVLGAHLRGDRAPRPERRRALRDDGGRATSTATSWCRCSSEALPRPRPWTSGSTRSSTAGVPASRVNDVAGGARSIRRRSRARTSSSTTTRRSGRVRSIRTPLRLADGADRLELEPVRGPFRGEHTEDVLVELCGYEPERVRALRDAGVFG